MAPEALAAAQTTPLRRVIMSSLIGTTIEWYDFFLYGSAAALVFSHLFFPSDDPITGTFLALGTYALGFVARPVGGIVFGHFGDRIGRKRLLMLSLILMGVATVLIGLLPSPETIEHFTDPEHAIAIARIENHYMANHGWLDEGQLLRDATKLRGIPGIIVQGRHDTCTPPKAAWQLKKAWPQVDLQIIADGGHLYNEPGILDGLVRATDKFAGL